MSPTASHCSNNKLYLSVPITATAARLHILSDSWWMLCLKQHTIPGWHRGFQSIQAKRPDLGPNPLWGRTTNYQSRGVSRQQKRAFISLESYRFFWSTESSMPNRPKPAEGKVESNSALHQWLAKPE